MSIEDTLSALEKKYGKGTVFVYGNREIEPVESISTGILSLDKVLGVGGLPKGRVVELYGPEASGKTTLSLHVMAEAQKKGETVAFVDVEHALDPKYASSLGVEMDKVIVSQPDSGEQALEVVAALVSSGSVGVVVVDSVAALTTRAELDGQMGDANVAKQARLMSQALRKLTHMVSVNKCLLVFINQLRDKIGVMFGPTETTTGGKALKYYASVRLDIRRVGSLKDGEEVIGSRTRVKVVKNKVSAPYKEVEFDLVYGKGASREGDLLDLAIASGIITKKGAWFSFEDKNFAQGRESAKEALKDDEFFNKVKALTIVEN